MFQNLTIGKKLGIGFGVLIFCLIIFIVLGIYFINRINYEVRDLDERYDKILYASEIYREVNAIHLKARKMMMINDIAKKQEIFQEIENHRKHYRKRLDELDKISRTDDGKQKIKDLVKASDETRDANNQAIKLALEGKNKEAIELYLSQVEAKSANREKALNELLQFNYNTANARIEAIYKMVATSKIFAIVLAVVSLGTALFFSIVIPRSIRKPVAELKDAIERIGQGDLTVEIKAESKDEIGVISNSLTQAISSIKNLIGQSKTISSSLASSSEQLSATTEEISRNLKSQTERASQIASAAEEMSQTVVDIAKNASNIAEVSVTTANVAKEGKDMTINTAGEIKVIEDSVNKLSGIVNDLGERSRQIGDIVTVIKDIADQTNLLALNAAIEAARAGEQGRGFAVVADEVRKLAERTAKATDEIADMIRGIQTEVNVAEQSMEDATKKVASGVELSEKAANTLTQILNKAQELQSMIQQIASATEEMSSVTDHITQDIGGIAEGSKEISVAVDQSAQTASDIARLGGELNAAIGRFKV
ncbi:methyl-accepting chemotaxis protein [Thermodesulfovibrio thiophilus]|uniref:methyl-accepting chemotaxis protein n=1 Tax=Thermodesulfovibrio thiophilus TaxID=340095 RepID=UPI0018334A9D|nr:methyl-accepting chemotaxis protein [Thermodesulfovibrio thiophilus]